MKLLILLWIILLSVYSCETDLSIEYPVFGENSLLINSEKIDNSVLEKLSGIYISANPIKRLGDTLVIKSSKNKLLIFCPQAVDFVILDAGIIDSGIVFEGYGRDLETVNVNLVRVFIRNSEGAEELLNGKFPESLSLYISVLYDSQSGRTEPPVKYNFQRKLNTSRKFNIIAHRGGARNSDLLPASENSLEMIKFAEYLGANAIEIDIRLTKDKIPVLFHDDYISKRLVDGDLLVGNIENYSLSHIRTFCTLKNGEKIPTLEEALDIAVNQTNLDFVWLDIKTPAVVDRVIPIIIKYNEICKNSGRNIKFYIGITSAQVRKQLLDNPLSKQVLSLSELNSNELSVSNSKVWAPQWTLGYQNEIVEKLHKDSIKSIVWTMDERAFIKEFIQNGKFDGILTNFAPIVYYEYYIRN